MARLGGGFVTLEALYQAYRKAKADVFFEKSQPYAVDFGAYEEDLAANLRRLQARLTDTKPTWFSDAAFIGGYGYLPKGLDLWDHPSTLSTNATQPHFSPSRPEQAWKYLLDQRKPQAKFRPVAHFSVDMYIVCALWVNVVGHKFDACLDRSVRGSRLRRYASLDTQADPAARPYHLGATGSFEPYFYAFHAWRKEGLAAIRRHLERHEDVVAITMDLTSFYHNIDPAFLLKDDFLKISGYFDRFGPPLPEERLLTEQLVQAFGKWARDVPGWCDGHAPGVPVGPSAPRVIANCLLCAFDREVQQKLSPVYYGRYVDDIFLVLRDPGTFERPADVLDYLVDRLPLLTQAPEHLQVTLPYAQGSDLRFNKKKQRIFLLSGEMGSDLIETIESKIQEVSSEWRLLPDLADLESSPAARVLTAAKDPSEDTDALRKADSLSIRRLGFSLMLRSCHALAADLPPSEWSKERERFYRFAREHVLNPLRLLDLSDYVPRLVSLAVACSDWRQASRLVRQFSAVVRDLRRRDLADEAYWVGYQRQMQVAMREAALGSLPFVQSQDLVERGLGELLAVIAKVAPTEKSELKDVADAFRIARQLALADLGHVPFKDQNPSVLRVVSEQRVQENNVDEDMQKYDPHRWEGVMEFVALSGLEPPSLRPLLFPTRPFDPAEITLRVPQCVTDVSLWCRLTNALRGVCLRPEATIVEDEDRVVRIGEKVRPRPPRLAVPSMLVEDGSWCRAAAGRPDLSTARYQRLVNLANDIIRAKSRPDYVLFPELSIPRKWIARVAHRFLRMGISVIAGLEYDHPIAGQVLNEARLYLTDDRLGFPSYCVCRQQKAVPAPHERQELHAKFGLRFVPADPTSTKRVYDHHGFRFGLLICSELTDIEHRRLFRGQVDAVFVLCWNKDLESFGSLVESSALDVHSYMALVNNRRYGDSRVRAPYLHTWLRDLVRVKGGLDDFFVVTELNVAQLREFQSHHESPNAGPFKPVPEGFQIAPARRVVPGGDDIHG